MENSGKKCGINDMVFDETHRPQDDYFNWINNKWVSENPIPDDFVRWGVFEQLHEETLKRLKGIVTDKDGDSNITLLYSQGNDSERLQKSGITSAQYLFDKINAIENPEQMCELLGEFAMSGLTCFYGTDVYPDAKETTTNVMYLSQSGLGMGDRDYYIIESKEKEREEYKKYLMRMFEKIGIDEHINVAKSVYTFEERLAKVSLTRTERRDPHRTYNVYSLEKLETEFPHIKWEQFLKHSNLWDYTKMETKGAGKIVLDNPKFFEELNTMMEMREHGLKEFKWCMINHVFNSVAGFLDDESYDIIFDYYGRVLSGQKEQKPRWKRVLANVQNNLGELVGQRYVAQYFSEESKKSALQMVNDLQESLREKIQDLDWMSPETKVKALKKMDHFRVKIGYPDKWRDFSRLSFDANVSYLENTLAARRFNIAWEYAQVDFPVDREKWEMNPQEINAYYHPLLNEIVFPAGILQAPFFDSDQKMAYNYGSIGAIIGHEMTHGFDDQGRKFDFEGNMVDWWTDEDAKRYDERTDVIKTQYSGYKIEGENVNGELTLGENIADIGGVLVAFNAFKKRMELEGCNRNIYSQHECEKKMKEQEEAFFLGWGRAWRGHIRPEAQRQRILTDPHSPAICRVNGVLKNIPDFHRIYGTMEGDELYLEPEKRAKIW